MALFKNRNQPGRLVDRIMRRSIGRSAGDWSLANSEAIFSAVSRIANTMATLPVHLYRGHEVQSGDWRDQLFTSHPNATMTPFVFVQTMEAQRNTEGNAYALIVPEADGTARLDVLEASRVVPERDVDTGEIWYTFTLDDGTTAQVHSSSMLALRYMSANGVKGVSPMDVLRGTLEYNKKAREFSLKQFESVNNGVILDIPATGLSLERKKEAINQFKEAYEHSNGDVIVLDGGIKATMMTRSPVDSKALEVERITKNRVAAVYNIPPGMLGDYSQTHAGDTEDLKQEFLDMTILPIVCQWENELNLKLLSSGERMNGYHFEIDTNALLRTNPSVMAEVYQKAVRGGWMMPNEVRDRENLAPQTGGDKLLCSRDLRTLEGMQVEEDLQLEKLRAEPAE